MTASLAHHGPPGLPHGLQRVLKWYPNRVQINPGTHIVATMSPTVATRLPQTLEKEILGLFCHRQSVTFPAPPAAARLPQTLQRIAVGATTHAHRCSQARWRLRAQRFGYGVLVLCLGDRSKSHVTRVQLWRSVLSYVWDISLMYGILILCMGY